MWACDEAVTCVRGMPRGAKACTPSGRAVRWNLWLLWHCLKWTGVGKACSALPLLESGTCRPVHRRARAGGSTVRAPWSRGTLLHPACVVVELVMRRAVAIVNVFVLRWSTFRRRHWCSRTKATSYTGLEHPRPCTSFRYVAAPRACFGIRYRSRTRTDMFLRGRE